LTTKGLDVKNVVLTSDEVDPAWWADVAKMGWKYPDHSKTQEEFNGWYVFIYIFYLVSVSSLIA
jgi:hypothetical protein